MELDALYQEYAKMLYRYIYLKCKDKNLAEDIVQITFLKAISQIDTFKGECKISTWLCQIAKNEYLNYCRKHNRQLSYEEYVEKNGEKAKEEEEYVPDVMIEKIIAKEQAGIVRKILHGMKEPYKEVFMLRVYGEYSFREIGELFDKNETWARVTYYRAKEKIIREIQEKEGFYEV